ncbi:MAG TPA: hypothetical protein VFE53_12915 [Mucilaginibacter sp.]|jgi:hypothetical protein|nr:hypothetical protein [Mucilaginibacter sp.]
MNKKVLAIYYTQSGQMTEIMSSLTTPLVEAGVLVEYVRIKPVEDFQFPWTGRSFFSVMPDCVLGVPRAIEEPLFGQEKYDLVILGYQPWFLSPSIPSNSLLQNQKFKKLIAGAAVVTISEARNMWINAYVRIRKMLADSGAKQVGNIALFDRHPNPVSFVTIFYWMLTGKKEKYLNIFPKPGVGEKDILGVDKFGKIVAENLASGTWGDLQDKLLAQKAVEIKYPLMFIEARAKPIFNAWAKIISKRKNKTPWLAAFKYYLFAALFLGAPILLTLDAVFLRPFSSKRIAAKKLGYMKINN